VTPRRGIGALIAVVIVVAVGLVIALGGGSQPTAARSLGVKGDGLPSLFASLSPTSRQRLLTMPFATRVRVLRTLKAADAEVARPVHTMPVYRGPASRIRRFHGASPVVDGVLPHAPRPVPGAAGRLEWSGRIVFRGGRFLSPPGERNASGVGEVQVFGESEVSGPPLFGPSRVLVLRLVLVRMRGWWPDGWCEAVFA
jgi:hypothetical protein